MSSAIGGSDLSLPALVQSMVRSEEAWVAATSFCEAVMLAKEEAERISEQTSHPSPATGDAGLRTVSNGWISVLSGPGPG